MRTLPLGVRPLPRRSAPQAAVADARKAAADEQLAAKIATDRLEAVAAQCAEHETKAAAQAQRIKELTSQVL